MGYAFSSAGIVGKPTSIDATRNPSTVRANTSDQVGKQVISKTVAHKWRPCMHPDKVLSSDSRAGRLGVYEFTRLDYWTH